MEWERIQIMSTANGGGGSGTKSGANLSSPADKDSIMDCAKQIRLTEMRACQSLRRRLGASQASI